MDKQIWIPKSETTVIVNGKTIHVTEQMTMIAKPIDKPPLGFSK